jgi:ribosomal protein S18 acetylase RimI-like enzyme
MTSPDSAAKPLPTLDEVSLGSLSVEEVANFYRNNTDWHNSDSDISVFRTLPTTSYTLVTKTSPSSDKSIVATASAVLLDQTTAFLCYVVTDVNLRRRGLAWRAVGHLLEILRGRGVKDVRLLASVHGVNLYERLGFVSTSQRIVLYVQPEVVPEETLATNAAYANAQGILSTYSPPSEETLANALRLCIQAGPPGT